MVEILYFIEQELSNCYEYYYIVAIMIHRSVYRSNLKMIIGLSL
ncbi:hypothetical protein HMPREF3218_0202284 [Prevotella bivia]|nr:hypothetical protein HMPREF3218_0202284 [Prevotella bivia]